MKTLAAILVEQKKPLAVEEVDIPALSVGQVLVQVLCSGICGSQIGEIDGVKGPDRFLPHLLGHEGTGVVMECGEGVSRLQAGDYVVLHWRKGAGMESLCPKYRSASGIVNAGWVTSFNQHAVVSENRLTKIPRDFDPEIGALMGCAVTTGFGVINNNAQLRIGESVIIFGAGGVGLNVVQAAALVSAYPIVVLDLFDHRLELARALGATHGLNAATTGVEEELRKIVGPQGVDVVIDNTGNPKVIEMAYRLTSAAGRTVLVGVPAKGREAHIYTLPLHFGKVLTGSYGGESRPEKDIPNYIRLYQAGKLNLKPLISKRYSLGQINEAISDLRAGVTAGRGMIHMLQ